MKIAVRSGHNSQAIGSVGILNEYNENVKVKNAMIKYFKALGHTVYDVSPGPMDSNSDLYYGVHKAKEYGVDLYIPVHFNKAYNSYKGAIGSEAYVHSSKVGNSYNYAQKMVKALETAGFKNRGVKHNDALYEMRVSKQLGLTCALIEVCFTEATEDVALYQKLGSDYIGKILVQAITGQTVSSNTNTGNTSSEIYRVRKTWADASSQIGAYSNLDNAKKICDQNPGYSVFNSKGNKVYPVVVSKCDPVVKAPYTEVGGSGKAKITTPSGIIFRDHYCTHCGIKQGTYECGESVIYDKVCVTENYVWISWVSASTGQRRWMPYKDRKTGETWATIS